MTDAFHSAEITPTGISVKVGTHRRAIGLGDYETKAEFIAAVSTLLKDVLGDDLALVAANVAAAETDASATVAALKDAHAAEKVALIAAHTEEKAALEADIATLGTKPEAVALRKAKERTKKLEQLAALTAELRADQHADAVSVDAVP